MDELRANLSVFRLACREASVPFRSCPVATTQILCQSSRGYCI